MLGMVVFFLGGGFTFRKNIKFLGTMGQIKNIRLGRLGWVRIG